MAIAEMIPSSVKTLAVIVAVYGLLQAVKKIPFLTAKLTGWWAIAFNVVLTALGELMVIPADQLYTANTFNILLTVVTVALGAAGLHGTVKSLSPPTVLAVIPPSTEAVEVRAVVVPVDPRAVVVKKDGAK